MSIENLLDQLKQLERPISQDARNSLLTELRAYPTERDLSGPSFWSRGHYFHSLEDIDYARRVYTANFPGEMFIRQTQACFVKDLDFYLEHLPQGEARMRTLFELILMAGTSADWENDKELVIKLNKLYWTLDKEVIRPWVNQK